MQKAHCWAGVVRLLDAGGYAAGVSRRYTCGVSHVSQPFVVAPILLVACLLASCTGPVKHASERELACGESGQPACRATFRAVAADKHRYDGRSIRIEGYLAVSRDLFVITSSKELYEAGVTDEVAVRIRGRLADQERAFNAHAYTWVSAIGRFKSAGDSGTTTDLLLGELYLTGDMRPLLDDVAFRRQEFKEVVLDLRDIE